jgi:diamine N-acetyltransferase
MGEGEVSVWLRRTTPDDLDFVLAAEGDEENAPFIGQWRREEHAAALADGDVAHLIIGRAEDGRRVGYVILTGLTDAERGIRLRRICVTEKGRGYGREAVRLVQRLAFEELGASRLWLMVRSHNARAQRLYESAGLIREAPDPEAGADAPVVMGIWRGAAHCLSRRRPV